MNASRRNLLSAALAVLLLAGFLAVLRARPAGLSSGINKANFDLIEEGMTQKDVEEIFGCPPGDYTNGQAVPWRCGLVVGMRQEFWIGYEGDIDVEFRKKDGTVVDKHFIETWIRPKPTWLDRIRGFFQ